MSASPHRDLVYCHLCQNEWYRDEHGLECPTCHSDVVEIVGAPLPMSEITLAENLLTLAKIEADHDPREMNDDTQPLSALNNHNPWREPGTSGYGARSDQGDIGTAQHTQMQSDTPQGGQPQHELVHGLFSGLLGNIAATNRTQAYQPAFRNQASPPPPPFPPFFTRRTLSGPDGHQPFALATPTARQPGSPGVPGPTTRTTHFSFGPLNIVAHSTVTSRTMINGQQVEQAQMGDDTDLSGMLQGALGPMLAGGTFMTGGQRGQPVGPTFEGLGSFGALLQHIFDPANAQSGDAVFTQEAMDRLMTRFMQENQTSSAPGPASASAIESLPRIRIGKEQLDVSTGRAECSICMDAAELGSDVAELPCKHWFHFDCIRAWLGEHDTCPQCRRGIMTRDDPGSPVTGPAAPSSPDGAAAQDANTDRLRRTGETPRNWQLPSPTLSRSATMEETGPAGRQAALETLWSSQPSGGMTQPAGRPQTGNSLEASNYAVANRWRRPSASRSQSDGERHVSRDGDVNCSTSGAGAAMTSIASGISGISGWMGRHFGGQSPTNNTTATQPSAAGRSSGIGEGGSDSGSNARSRSGNQRSTTPGQWQRAPSQEDFDLD